MAHFHNILCVGIVVTHPPKTDHHSQPESSLKHIKFISTLFNGSSSNLGHLLRQSLSLAVDCFCVRNTNTLSDFETTLHQLLFGGGFFLTHTYNRRRTRTIFTPIVPFTDNNSIKRPIIITSQQGSIITSSKPPRRSSPSLLVINFCVCALGDRTQMTDPPDFSTFNWSNSQQASQPEPVDPSSYSQHQSYNTQQSQRGDTYGSQRDSPVNGNGGGGGGGCIVCDSG